MRTYLRRFVSLAALTGGLLFFGAGAVPALAAAQPSKTLVFWHYWTDDQTFLDEMAQRYQMETNVKVDFQLFSPTGRDYWSKVQTAAQANRLPDILGTTDDPELLARYVKAGKIVDLTQEMRANQHAWEYSFFPRTVNALYFPKYNIYGVLPDRIWGVPLSAMNIQVFYNRELFQKAGLDPDQPPATWDAFIQAGQTLRKAGVDPLVCGFGDLWLNQTFFRIYAWPILGQDKIRSLYVGELPYTAPECRQVLDCFLELRDQKFLYPGAASLNNKEAEIIFSRGRAAMMINGSWGVNVLKQMNPELKFGVMSFPPPRAAAYPMYVVGGLGRAALVTANSKHPKEAIKFLRWLTAQPQQERWARLPNGFPAMIKAQDAMHPDLAPFLDKMKDLAPNLYLEERQEVLEALSKGMQSLLIGDSDPQSVLEKVEEIKKKKAY